MSDYYETVEAARARLILIAEELRGVACGDRPPLGPWMSEMYADWCDAIAQVLAEL